MTARPRRLNTAHIERHCRRAITARLGYHAPEAVRAVTRDGGTVVVHLNSGGNALEAQSYLRQRGYAAELGGDTSDGYGCAVRVTLTPDN